tara:strand:+ start:780 stop:1208 length:429 start_codon:yes stop_codon:yes gene_type:complete
MEQTKKDKIVKENAKIYALMDGKFPKIGDLIISIKENKGLTLSIDNNNGELKLILDSSQMIGVKKNKSCKQALIKGGISRNLELNKASEYDVKKRKAINIKSPGIDKIIKKEILFPDIKKIKGNINITCRKLKKFFITTLDG